MAFRCGHSSSLARCQTVGCRGHAIILCDHPVKRSGRLVRCNRHVCKGCAKKVGERYFCPPHARATGDALVSICAACFTASCVSGEMPCSSPGRTRILTVVEWKRILTFGLTP